MKGEVSLRHKGFWIIRNFLEYPIDRLSLRRYIVADLGNTDPKGANLLGEKHRSIEWSRVTGTRPSGMVPGAVPEPRCRPRKGQASGAKVSPNEEPRGAQSWFASEGYSGLSRVSGGLDDGPDRLAQLGVGRGAGERGVAEGEDAAVRGGQEIALARAGGDHPDDRLGDGDVAERAEEAGVAEGEDAAVRGREPVALAGPGGGHAHDRLVERGCAEGAEEGGVAEGEDATV